MKFKKLSKKFNELLAEKDKGREPKETDIEKFLSLLEEKKASNEAKLQSRLSEKDRHKTEVKLKVIELQIGKLREMADRQGG